MTVNKLLKKIISLIIEKYNYKHLKIIFFSTLSNFFYLFTN